MTLADDIAATLQQEAAPAIAEAFFADTYEVVRETATPDGYGGTTTTTGVIGTGRCRLVPADRLGREGVRGDRIEAGSPYVAQLPRGTDVRATDTLRINGRDFAIVDAPKTGGGFGLFTEVSLEERS